VRLALLGGSFDPPHLGHLLLAASALWVLEPDEVWLLPVYRHPFAKALTPFAHRLAMTRLAVEPLGSRVRALALEEQLAAAGGGGTTVELLRHLRAEDAERSLLWLMGADLAKEQARWAAFPEVERLSTVVWFNRAGHRAIPGGGPALPDVSATEVRERLYRGQGVHGLVPEAVARYIAERKLYHA